jgi:hypothetical protein
LELVVPFLQAAVAVEALLALVVHLKREHEGQHEMERASVANHWNKEEETQSEQIRKE